VSVESRPPANEVLRAVDALRVARVACESCGAMALGNMFCAHCVRWQKRLWRERFEHSGEFLRVLLKIIARGLYKEIDKAES